MLRNVTLLWLFGLLTIVPYATWHLLFTAGRDEYAFLITLVLFWIFGFWGVVGPLIAAWRVRQLFRALELASDPEERRRLLLSAESEEIAVDLVASENRIPKLLARRVVRYAKKRLGEVERV